MNFSLHPSLFLFDFKPSMNYPFKNISTYTLKYPKTSDMQKNVSILTESSFGTGQLCNDLAEKAEFFVFYVSY